MSWCRGIRSAAALSSSTRGSGNRPRRRRGGRSTSSSDPVYAERATAFSRKVRDVSQLLAQAPLNGRLRPVRRTVTYHDACHLAHGQRVRQEPRTILKGIPELRFVELEESDFCCGSAGIYNLLHPELARQFLDRKIERIKETGAELVVSGNPGCSLQIEKGLKERGLDIRALHTVELLDWSYRGTERYMFKVIDLSRAVPR